MVIGGNEVYGFESRGFYYLMLVLMFNVYSNILNNSRVGFLV